MIHLPAVTSMAVANIASVQRGLGWVEITGGVNTGSYTVTLGTPVNLSKSTSRVYCTHSGSPVSSGDYVALSCELTGTTSLLLYMSCATTPLIMIFKWEVVSYV